MNKFPDLLNLKRGVSITILSSVFSIFLLLGFLMFAFYRIFSPPESLLDASRFQGIVIAFPDEVKRQKVEKQETGRLNSSESHSLNQDPVKMQQGFLLTFKTGSRVLLASLNLTTIPKRTEDTGIQEKDIPGIDQNYLLKDNQIQEDQTPSDSSDPTFSQAHGQVYQDTRPQMTEIVDARTLLDPVLASSTDVISYKLFSLADFSPVLPFIAEVEDPSLVGNTTLMFIKLDTTEKSQIEALEKKIKDVLPEAILNQSSAFFAKKQAVMWEVADRFLYGLLIMGIGLVAFMLVMARNLFQQHLEDTQNLAYLGADPHVLRGLYFRFFKKRFLKSLCLGIVLATLAILIFVHDSSLADYLYENKLNYLFWIVQYAVVTTVVLFLPLELVLRRQVKTLL